MQLKRVICVFCLIFILFASIPTRIYASQEHQAKRIVLTFDDGPHPKQTRQILDVLDHYGIKATFFVIGINVKHYPEVLGEVLKRGHEIGNHTYDHSHAAKLDADAFERQILDCEQEIFLKSGTSVHLFRPPEGAVSKEMKQIIRDLGYINVLWTLDTRDWAHTPPEQICEHVVSNAKNGDIILMHDYIGVNSPTVQALELMIPKLLEQNFTFVTMGELLADCK